MSLSGCSASACLSVSSMSPRSPAAICFFKQKTAYELRISDWSSDVCSSDLPLCSFYCPTTPDPCHDPRCSLNRSIYPRRRFADRTVVPGAHDTREKAKQGGRSVTFVTFRSEEHTSELQSLMRISYAVFCLKKKKKQKPNATPHQPNTR